MVFLFLVFSQQEVVGQTAHEIGLIGGPVVLLSDYGVRSDFDSNMENSGIGIGLVHYLKFTYSSGRMTKFEDHFMIRNEFLYHKVDLQHYGKWVAPHKTSKMAEQLRAMKGSATTVEIGSQLEYYFLSVRKFNGGDHRIAPYVGFGVRLVLFSPTVSSSLGPLNTEDSTPAKYFNAFQNNPGSTLSLVGNAGFRFKLTRDSDLLLEGRWHTYMSDWVDGLNPSFENNKMVDVPENKSKDWLFWLAAGYVFYLN